MSIKEVIELLHDLKGPAGHSLRLPSAEEVSAAENSLGFQLPADYRYFLLNGSDVVYGMLKPAVVVPHAGENGHPHLAELVNTARRLGMDMNLLPFCEEHGDFYCIEPDGRIVLWSPDGSCSGSWKDLADWIEFVWIHDM